MSNKSGASEQVISLPQRGGALTGIGETFSPDLHTGTGNFTPLIALPPQLSLVYGTGNGNGPFGLGWSWNVPGVSRKTSRCQPRCRDDGPNEQPDTFILSVRSEAPSQMWSRVCDACSTYNLHGYFLTARDTPGEAMEAV